MSVTLIAYPTTSFINDLAAWNNFNTRADADGADTKEDACFDCLYLRFAGLNAMPELAYVLDTMGGTDIAVTYSIGDIEDVTKQRGSFSKTITLPNTPTNRACFAYAYNIQANLPNGFKLPDSYLFDYNFSGAIHECPLMDDQIFDINEIIASLSY